MKTGIFGIYVKLCAFVFFSIYYESILEIECQHIQQLLNFLRFGSEELFGRPLEYSPPKEVCFFNWRFQGKLETSCLFSTDCTPWFLTAKAPQESPSQKEITSEPTIENQSQGVNSTRC